MGWVRVVDVDVAFALSFAVDAAWLWAAGQAAGVRGPALRLILAAALGALADVLVLFPVGGPLRTGPGRLLASLVAVVLAYGGQVAPRALWRLLGYFYLLGMLMAGAGVLLAMPGQGFTVATAGAVATVFAAPAPFSVWVALGVALAVTGGRVLLAAAAAWRRLRAGTREVEVTLDTGCIRLTALVDTGCRVQEPISRRPVLVAEAAALAPVLPAAVTAAARAPGAGPELALLPPEWARRVRLVPYTGVGRGSGLLLAVRADGVAVAGRPGGPAYVALSPEPLDPSGAFRALLPGDWWALSGRELA